MKRILRTTSVLATSLLASAFLPGLEAKPFEGVVEFEIRDGRRTMPMNYAIKGSKIRFDIEESRGAGMAGASILNLETGEMIVLMPQQNMYMRLDTERLAGMGAEMAPGGGEPPVDLAEDDLPKPTGETREILGHTCHQYIIKDADGDTTEFWSAEGLGFFFGHPQQFGSAATIPQHLRDHFGDRGFFPLLMIQTDRRGRETMRMEAKSITPRELEDSLFVPPANFREFSMPQF